MPASYNGNVTIGGCVPGLADAFDDVGSALETLRDEVVLHLPCFLEAIAAMADVRIVAVADFQAQLNAAIGIQLQLSAQLANPADYLAQLIAALQGLLLSIPVQLPVVALSTQIAAAAAVEAVFALKIAAIDAKIAIVVDLLNACYLALLAVSTASFAAIETFHTYQGYLETSGAYAFSYSGAMGGAPDALASALPLSGVPTATNVVMTLQFVKSSDSAAVGAHAQTFLVP